MDKDKLFEEVKDPELRQFFENLRQVHYMLEKGFKSKLNRSLPFADEVFNRWERAESCGFGNGASIYDSSYVFGDVKVGESSWIGPFTILDGSGGLKIGSYCSISSGVQIYTHDTVKWALSGGKQATSYKPVSIGNNCYIGPNVIISKGVEIGQCSVIGANSFVNKSIPPYSVAYGTPAKVVGEIQINQDDIEIQYYK